MVMVSTIGLWTKDGCEDAAGPRMEFLEEGQLGRLRHRGRLQRAGCIMPRYRIRACRGDAARDGPGRYVKRWSTCRAAIACSPGSLGGT